MAVQFMSLLFVMGETGYYCSASWTAPRRVNIRRKEQLSIGANCHISDS
jgi:hypothetical protein